MILTLVILEISRECRLLGHFFHLIMYVYCFDECGSCRGTGSRLDGLLRKKPIIYWMESELFEFTNDR